MQLLDSKSEDIFVTSHGVTSQIRRMLSSEKNWIPKSASFVLKKNIDRYLHDPTKARFQIVKYKTTTHYAHRCFQNFIDVFASVKRIKILSMADTREVRHLQRLKALYTAGRFVPNALDQQGLCHIHHAAYRGYLVCTKWLIKRGSSLTAR